MSLPLRPIAICLALDTHFKLVVYVAERRRAQCGRTQAVKWICKHGRHTIKMPVQRAYFEVVHVPTGAVAANVNPSIVSRTALGVAMCVIFGILITAYIVQETTSAPLQRQNGLCLPPLTLGSGVVQMPAVAYGSITTFTRCASTAASRRVRPPRPARPGPCARSGRSCHTTRRTVVLRSAP